MNQHHRKQDPGRHAEGKWRAWTWWRDGVPYCIEVERDDDGTLHVWVDGKKTDAYPDGFEPEPEWLREPAPHRGGS